LVFTGGIAAMSSAYAGRTKSFGNGRYVRNLFEAALEEQANRLATDLDLDETEVVTIEPDDIPTELLGGMKKREAPDYEKPGYL